MEVDLFKIFKIIDSEIESHKAMKMFNEIIPHFRELSQGGITALEHFKGKLEKEFGLIYEEINEVEEEDGKKGEE